MRTTIRVCGAAVAAACALAGGAARGAQVEPENTFPWYVSVSGGVLQFEGDEAVESGFVAAMRLGYDWTEWWSLEAVVTVPPYLKENHRFDYPSGRYVSRLEETDAEGTHSTWGLGLAGDALFHFTRWERFDPYLALGGGLMYYNADLGDGQVDPSLRAGGGVMFHFNDEWALRTDFRFFFAGTDTEANSILDAGVVWYWGAGRPMRVQAIGGPLDSDGDGLPDKDETDIYRTDPYDPDTDDDGLRDGEEVLRYKTNPLEKDTDFDGLMDGEEVVTYTTDPLDRDTDDGGVADGHEVLEDDTNPRAGHGADDLMLITLKINFDWNSAMITSQYFRDLDVVAKVLQRNPDATARIEGHADRNWKSLAGYNKKLSQRRAEACKSYLNERDGIDLKRMEAVGYGFDRPKEKNDPKKGSAENRRVEVYLRGVDKTREAALTGAAVPAGAVLPENK